MLYVWQSRLPGSFPSHGANQDAELGRRAVMRLRLTPPSDKVPLATREHDDDDEAHFAGARKAFCYAQVSRRMIPRKY